jgi:hypothetical protein
VVVGFTADMASPLSLQHANTLCYLGDFSSHNTAINTPAAFAKKNDDLLICITTIPVVSDRKRRLF